MPEASAANVNHKFNRIKTLPPLPKTAAQLLGVLGDPEVEIGYDIRSDHWGRGIATEAAGAVRDFAFEQLRLPRVISLIRPDNVASRRVAEKVGFALVQKATFWAGTFPSIM